VVTAYILIQTEVGKAAKVAKEIVKIQGVQQAEDVTGPYDVIVRADARNIDELASSWSHASRPSTASPGPSPAR
jgi:DNA-binding Lrp family transcriptional regulator